MSRVTRPGRGNGFRPYGARFASYAALHASLWLILTGNRGWLAGTPVVLLAAWASCLAPATRRWSIRALVAFVPYFIVNSVRGGLDVARRALHPALPLAPAIISYECRLRSATARVFMANVVTLLPGTLSADLDGATLKVHVLNSSDRHVDMLRDLERRIGRVCAETDAGTAA